VATATIAPALVNKFLGFEKINNLLPLRRDNGGGLSSYTTHRTKAVEK
jgi:hypothetical protein